ncbi:MAG: nitrous oxide-stimulated promoter family protein [Campylobacteraceae bacterium]|nr:nitrous oxide-stimulated promoter family protein [Campylobacteraceae bacterium]
MTIEKFDSEIKTLKKFFEYYCEKKHDDSKLFIKSIVYKEHTFVYEFNICEECIKDINYSINKLENCVHEEKPRCRKCPNPCYEKNMWKKFAKIMKYSGIHFKLNSIKSSLFS